MNKLLFDDYTLIILPTLAKVIGLNEAVVLQQVHYWLRTSPHMRDGIPWIYNSYTQWQEQFPFWSLNTFQRTVRRLENKGFLKSGNFNRLKVDKTKWYTLDYAALGQLADRIGVHLFLRNGSNGQDDAMAGPVWSDLEPIMSQPSAQNGSTIPETTSEITSEITPTATGPSGSRHRRPRKQAVAADLIVDPLPAEAQEFCDHIGILGNGIQKVRDCLKAGNALEDIKAMYDGFKGDQTVESPVGLLLHKLPSRKMPVEYFTGRGRDLDLTDNNAECMAPVPKRAGKGSEPHDG